MDLFQAITVFVRVVESGSMTAAAEQSGISPTMVSNHLRALEEHLGATLLRRTTRRQSLTEFGQAYFKRCTEILGMVADSERLAEEGQSTPRGLLRVTAPNTFGVERLMPCVANYLAAYPAVDLDIVLTDRVVDLLEDGFDAAIRLGPLETSRLDGQRLRNYDMVICAAPAYLERRGGPATLQELAQHDCLDFAYEAGNEWHWAGKHWRMAGHGAAEVRGRITVNSTQALRRAALGGVGIAMLAEVLVADDIAAGRLVRLLAGHQLPSQPMHILYYRDRYNSPKLRSFVEFVMATFGQDIPA